MSHSVILLIVVLVVLLAAIIILSKCIKKRIRIAYRYEETIEQSFSLLSIDVDKRYAKILLCLYPPILNEPGSLENLLYEIKDNYICHYRSSKGEIRSRIVPKAFAEICDNFNPKTEIPRLEIVTKRLIWTYQLFKKRWEYPEKRETKYVFHVPKSGIIVLDSPLANDNPA
ncbi:hypothetical protein IKF63_01045 [Candidatus Saccharibacteria bacterium]|nr:hypothetical protein [Candidatus Saccharibacteria bacterium]